MKPEIITILDIVKVMGCYTGFFCALTFFWMRHLKNEMRIERKETKADMREMFKAMQASFEETYIVKLDSLTSQLKRIEGWYLGHFRKYHSKE